MFHKKSSDFKAVKVSVWSMMERPTAVTSMCTLFSYGITSFRLLAIRGPFANMCSVVSIGVGSRKGGSEAHFIVFEGFAVRVSWVCAVMYSGHVVRRC